MTSDLGDYVKALLQVIQLIYKTILKISHRKEET